MTMWLAISFVGLGSYAIRVIPFLLGERIRVSEKADAALRHAAIGAMTALLVLGVQRATTDPSSADTLAVGPALAIAGTVALAGRSMLWVVASGAVTYGLASGVMSVVLGR